MTDFAYYCDKCRTTWQFDTAQHMAEFATRHCRECRLTDSELAQ